MTRAFGGRCGSSNENEPPWAHSILGPPVAAWCSLARESMSLGVGFVSNNWLPLSLRLALWIKT